TEKLPGSIFTVAAEVEALGAQALPIQVDVREAEQIDSMAARTLERFGRIDLLVNNAGALQWAGILDTSPKRFDLVMDVNARAAVPRSPALSDRHDPPGSRPHHQHESAARSVDPAGPCRIRYQQVGDDAPDRGLGGRGEAAQRGGQLALARHDHRIAGQHQ